MRLKAAALLPALIILACANSPSAATEVFFDDFEQGAANWDLSPGWSVAPADGGNLLYGTEHSFATASLGGTPNRLDFRLKLANGSLHANMRSRQADGGLARYFIGLNKGSSYINKQAGSDFSEFAKGAGISENEWHNITIEVQDEGKMINVFSDGKPILSAQDADFLTEGGASFEAFEGSGVYIDDVRAEVSMPDARMLKAGELFQNGIHRGDITLEGRDSLLLENAEFEQFGNIHLKHSSRLIIRNSTLKLSRHERLLNHWGIDLDDRASLQISDSRLLPGEGALFVILARGNSNVTLANSPTGIHLFQVFGSSKGLIENSTVVGDIGGLVGAYDKADVKVVDSKIGAVNLYIPSGATFEARGLGTGFFRDWNLHRNAKTSGIGYNITLTNTELVEDNIGTGPFERGWPVFLSSSSRVRISDSELRKVVIELNDEKAEFSNLALEKPARLSYRDIELENVTVKGQWGFFPHGSSDVTVRNVQGFWTFIFDDSNLTVIDTYMNEFDPRHFKGQVTFENSSWDTAVEILDDNDFTMRGSLSIGELGGFSWERSNVTRIFGVQGKPNSQLSLRKGDKLLWQGKTDGSGGASFAIRFDDSNFGDRWELEDETNSLKSGVAFTSTTPIKPGETHIGADEMPPPPREIRLLALAAAVLAIALAAAAFLLLRKRR